MNGINLLPKVFTLPLCRIYQWENWWLDATRASLTHARDDLTAYAYENEACVLLEKRSINGSEVYFIDE